MLIASLSEDKRKRYERIRGRSKAIDYTSLFAFREVTKVKVIGLCGRLLVETVPLLP